MSNATMKVKVVSGKSWFEGIVDVDGLCPTKLQKRTGDSTHFQTRSALITAAKTIAKRFGFNQVKIIEKGSAIVKKASMSIPPKPRKTRRSPVSA